MERAGGGGGRKVFERVRIKLLVQKYNVGPQLECFNAKFCVANLVLIALRNDLIR